MMKKLITFSLLFFHSMIICQTTASGDVFTRVSNIISNMPGDTGDDYSTPSAAQLTTFQQIMADLIAGNYSDADTKAATVGYDVVEFTETTITPNPTYYILEKEAASTNHWGTYIYNPSPCRTEVAIQSPHSKKDFNTGKQGVHIFRKIDAHFFFLNGTSRCNHSTYTSCSGTTSVCGTSEDYRISDMAHVEDAVFHAITEYVFDNVAGTHFLQLHGFTKQATDPYVILSNGTTSYPSGTDYTPDIKNHLYIADNVLTSKIGHIDNWTRLIGTTNTQGRYINGSMNPCTSSASSAVGRFIHIEQERTRLRNDVAGWDKMAFALAQTFVGSNCLFLPVELYSFDVRKEKESVSIRWETASEIGVDYFIIERSENGIDWKNMHEKTATNQPSVYSFSDRDLSPGKYFYRLKIIDLDDSYYYSETKAIEFNRDKPISFYPIPVKDILYVESKNTVNAIRISDILQREIYFNNFTGSPKELDVSFLNDGYYIISFHMEGIIQNDILIKK